MTNAEGLHDIEDLDDDGSRQKEVFARFGLAVYQAQVLEHGLVNVLVLSERMAGGLPTDEAFDARMNRLFSETTANLKRRLTNSGHLDPSDAELLAQAVAKRNYLAHDFFREHAQDFVTAAGSQRMLDDADRCRGLFDRADQRCDDVVNKLLERAGMSREDARQELERLTAQARAADA